MYTFLPCSGMAKGREFCFWQGKCYSEINFLKYSTLFLVGDFYFSMQYN
jgi:hypothetical protein